MRKLLSSRILFLLLGLASVGLLSFGFFLQYFVALVPCPLCIVQRFFYLFIALSAFASYFWSPKLFSLRVGGGLIAFFAAVGGGFAIRHVWLQHFPIPHDPSKCLVSFGSFFQSVVQALGGRGSCSAIDWTFLTLSIPEWSLLWFIIFFGVGLCLALRKDGDEAQDRSKNQTVM